MAERVAEFEAVGVDLLLLQCSPQLEEMERFAEAAIGRGSAAYSSRGSLERCGQTLAPN